MIPKWFFDEHEMDRRERNSVNEEFFTNNTSIAAIIREGIQNSLDAKAGESRSPVFVRIYYSGVGQQLLAKSYLKYRNGADDHYDMSDNGLEDVPSKEDDCMFFVIEDFNTTGLTGDTYHKPAKGAKKVLKNYYNYFYRENITDKGDNGTLGSWGAGKAVFQRASRLRSSFAYSTRLTEDGSRDTFLVGTSMFQVREDESGKTWDPDGWFGIKEEKDPDDSRKLLKQPIRDDKILKEFCNDFKLMRDDKLGTSIVIPYLVAEEESFDKTDEEMVRYMATVVLSNFMPAIIRGELLVEVGCGNVQPFKVDATSAECVSDWLEPLCNKGVTNQHLEIVRAACKEDIPCDSKFVLRESDRCNEWHKDLFHEGDIERTREGLKKGATLVFDIPVVVQPKKGKKLHDHYRLAIKKARCEDAFKTLYYRGGLLIDDIKTKVPSGYISVVTVDNTNRLGLLMRLLTASEPPSHSDWRQNAQRCKQQFVNAAKSIEFVKTAVSSIIEILDKSNEDPEWGAFADVFSVPAKHDCENQALTDNRVEDSSGANHDERNRPAIADHIPDLLVEAVSDGTTHGFKVRSNKDCPTPRIPPTTYLFKVFYNTLGTPDWRQSDFMLEDRNAFSIVEEPKGSVHVKARGNTLSFRIFTAGPFCVSVKGFDESRDIVIKEVKSNNNILE